MACREEWREHIRGGSAAEYVSVRRRNETVGVRMAVFSLDGGSEHTYISRLSKTWCSLDNPLKISIFCTRSFGNCTQKRRRTWWKAVPALDPWPPVTRIWWVDELSWICFPLEPFAIVSKLIVWTPYVADGSLFAEWSQWLSRTVLQTDCTKWRRDHVHYPNSAFPTIPE